MSRLLHVTGELSHEFQEDIRELKEDIQGLRESQNDTTTHLQNTISELNDDIKIIKEQLLLLTQESKRNRDSDQLVQPSKQGCSRDTSDVIVSVDDNEMELRNQTSTQSESYLLKIIKLDR